MVLRIATLPSAAVALGKSVRKTPQNTSMSYPCGLQRADGSIGFAEHVNVTGVGEGQP